MSTHKSHNPNGRDILVLDGKEITREHMSNLSDEQVTQVKKRKNGPHHDSKWAIHRRQKIVEVNRYNPFTGIVQLRNLVITPKP